LVAVHPVTPTASSAAGRALPVAGGGFADRGDRFAYPVLAISSALVLHD